MAADRPTFPFFPEIQSRATAGQALCWVLPGGLTGSQVPPREGMASPQHSHGKAPQVELLSPWAVTGWLFVVLVGKETSSCRGLQMQSLLLTGKHGTAGLLHG